MINAKVFAAMKPTAFLTNLARGGVVDEDALIEALARQEDRGRGARRVQPGAAAARRRRCGRSRTSSSPPIEGGFCDTYVDLAMPILEHNMRCFPAGDLKGMMNVARAAA